MSTTTRKMMTGPVRSAKKAYLAAVKAAQQADRQAQFGAAPGVGWVERALWLGQLDAANEARTATFLAYQAAIAAPEVA